MGKQQFLDQFGQFLAENVSELEIDRIIYDRTDEGEFAYICYLNKNQKRIDITASSTFSIIKDIVNNIESVDYLLPSQRKYLM